MSTGLDALTKKNIDTWLTGNYDEETKAKIQQLVDEEKETDVLLTEIAENNINWEAEQEVE